MPKRMGRRRRAGKPRRRMYRRKAPSREMASLKEVHQFTTLDCNTAYRDYQTSLARYQRASNVAQAYREFRITKLEYQFIPLVDTFTQTDYVSGISKVPQLYTMIDKTGAFGDFTLGEELERAGAKPRRLDDKNLFVRFKPCVLNFAYDANNLTNPWTKPIVSPWLSCDKWNTLTGQPFAPSSTDHLGLVWIVDAQAAIKYEVRCTAHFQFRKPALIASSTKGPTAVQPPSKNPEPIPEPVQGAEA